MGKAALIALLIVISLISLNAAEECKSVQVKPPGSCTCGSTRKGNSMWCTSLEEPPVIPNYVNNVYFVSNDFTRVPAYMFANATNLRLLCMNDGDIQFIDDDAFQNLTKLTEIDIFSNYITFPETLFHILDTCPQLRELKTEQSFSGVIDTRYLPKHHHLSYLDLSSNRFTDSPDFRNLHQLKKLKLKSISLSQFMPYFHFEFSGMQYLANINLENIESKWIECDVFDDLPNLEYLYLGSNSQLGYATLASNAGCLFRDLIKLKVLDLSNNLLQTLPKVTFQDLKKLQILNLSRSQIETLPKTLFHPLKEIKEINLEFNKLTFLYPEHFQNLRKLNSLNLLNNQFQCICSIRPFVAWLHDNINHIWHMDNLTCTSQDDMSEKPLVHYKPSWISCDNHGWLLAGLSGTFLLTILLISLTVYYFRWDIRFWLAVRGTRARMLKNGTNESEADERTRLIQDQEEYHAFASYCSRDSQWVKKELVVNLEEADDIQFRLCIDDRDLTPSVSILNNISLKMSQSKKIIFVVSRSFIASRWCTFEVELAQTRILDENSGMIIIIFLENIPNRDMPKSLCRLCKHVTHITWDDSPRKQVLFWKRLKLAMNA